jgi:hypothetical protein
MGPGILRRNKYLWLPPYGPASNMSRITSRGYVGWPSGSVYTNK